MRHRTLFYFTMLSFLLSGCSELYELRQIRDMQEKRIAELQNQNAQYRDSHFKMKEEKDKYAHDSAIEIANLKARVNDLQSNRSETETRLTDDNTALRAELQEIRTNLNSTASELKLLQDKTSVEASRIQAETERLKNELETARKNEDALKSGKQSLEEALDQKEVELKILKAQIEKDRADIARLNEEKSALEKRAVQADSGADRVRSLQAEVDQLKKSLAAAQKVPSAVQDPELASVRDELTKSLAVEISGGNLQISLEKKGLVIRMNTGDLFDPGTVILAQNAAPLLAKIAALLNKFPSLNVDVEGHTDDQPIENMPFVDNLALSSSRADNVARFLTGPGNVSLGRVRSIACSWYQPLASNKTPEGRRQNRRVEIVLISRK